MTKEKAKSYLKHMLEMMAAEPPENLVDERDIREWEDEHSNIRDTLEVSLAAVEKQIPKKPNTKSVIFGEEAEEIYVCSVCESLIGSLEGQPYCENCGNAIDWEEGEIK